ncbi:hypothetical protein [Paenibacillus alkalitolerans]|uniref:hypothetical protein n=1 Tax=Paenibacillus alkalitolerans TaxID=2799335 RepID=UPI0018F5A4EA|nr:hypothetical protein [Paenibacillus alkalitolerans]
MIIVPYIQELDGRTARNGSCVHLSDVSAVSRCYGTEDLWLESYASELTLAAARGCLRPVLNSLPLDEQVWKTYEQRFSLFHRFVLLPFRPGVSKQNYDENVDAVIELAGRYGIPLDRCIVDLCIMPKSVIPDLSVYKDRISALQERGLSTCAGVNNYIYNEDPAQLPDAVRAISSYGLTYGIISEHLLKYIS